MNPTAPSKLYTVTNRVWATANGAESWLLCCPLRPQTARRGLTDQKLFRWQSPSSLFLQTTLNRKVNSFSAVQTAARPGRQIKARAGRATVCGIDKCISKQFTNFGRRSVLRATNYRHGVWEIATPTTNHPLTAIQYRTSNLSVARGTTLIFSWHGIRPRHLTQR